MLLASGHRLDEFHAAEAGRLPVFINRNHPDGFEAHLTENLPAGIAVDLAFVTL
jgi:hypothetical protein